MMSQEYDNTGVADLDLTQFDDDFEAAEVEEREFEDVPDGKYQVKVEKVELTKAQTTGNPMLKWTLKILGPKCAGRFLWRNSMFASKENLKWLKTDLHTCGVDITKLSELPGRLGDLLDVTLEVTKRTKGDNENVFFNRRVVVDDLPVEDDSLAPF
jgi:hypothetical protein